MTNNVKFHSHLESMELINIRDLPKQVFLFSDIKLQQHHHFNICRTVTYFNAIDQSVGTVKKTLKLERG